jgi:hypothetical protein
MHYRTQAIAFLEPADAFLATSEQVTATGSEHALNGDGAGVLHMAAPLRD